MAITLELYEVKNLFMEMAELGAANYAKQMAPASDLVSQREAFKLFGEGRVKNWVGRKLLAGQRTGAHINSKVMYSRAELLALDKTERFTTILNKRTV